MINQMSQNENTQNQFSNAIRELKVGKLLRKANITKLRPFQVLCKLETHEGCLDIASAKRAYYALLCIAAYVH